MEILRTVQKIALTILVIVGAFQKIVRTLLEIVRVSQKNERVFANSANGPENCFHVP
jgi:hypothetical protein